jgi:flagellar hook assembly protein FlgD
VAYEVPQSSEVAIRVYDVAGKLVRTLVDGSVEPGRYAVTWDGTSDGGESVGSGVYFCVMDAPSYHATHKMMLLK